MGDRQSILVVDDDQDIREVLEEAFVDAGYEVQTAANGLEALTLLRKGPLPRIVLLDLMMPVMDGYQFIEARRADPTLLTVPVVLITASGQLDQARLDGVPVVSKPIKLAKLMELVAQHG